MSTHPQPPAITHYSEAGWAPGVDPEVASRADCARLEAGEIIYFENPPFEFPQEHRDFLVGVRQTGSKVHKNIAYKPERDSITGLDKDSADAARFYEVLSGYSKAVQAFAADYLRPYQRRWKVDYATFRPFQEKGRDIRMSARNDLMHVDNFPTRPTNGDRILRVFVNINPTEPREWITGPPMAEIAPQYAEEIGVPKMKQEIASPLYGLRRGLLKAGSSVGLPVVDRSPYDQLMLTLHHAMKRDEKFQQEGRRHKWSFPPGCCWMFLADTVPHAVLEGQYALEQTFIVSREALVRPEVAPIRVLESLAGVALSP